MSRVLPWLAFAAGCMLATFLVFFAGRANGYDAGMRDARRDIGLEMTHIREIVTDIHDNCIPLVRHAD